MQGRCRIEYRHEQVVTEFRIQLHPGIHDRLQRNVALDDKQGAGFGGGETGRRQHYFIIDTFAKLASMPGPEGRSEPIAEPDQRPANLWLKQYDDRKGNEEQTTATDYP